MKNVDFPFADLSTEHQAFVEFLNKCEKNLFNITKQQFDSFAFLLESVHHKKEEDFLFPMLEQTKVPNQGGPKCSTYFTPRVFGAVWKEPFRDLQEHLSSAGPIQTEDLTPFRQKIWAANSMLKIPLEDHIWGARAVHQLKLALENRSGNPEKPAQLFAKFSTFLKDHMQREDECLFQLFNEALTWEQKQSYINRARAFEEKAETGRLLQSISAFQ